MDSCAFLCCREAVKRLSTRHGGSGGAIVNVSSAPAGIGSPTQHVDYAASKPVLGTLTRWPSLEAPNERTQVNAVRPSIIHPGIHTSSGPPDRLQRFAPFVPV